MRCTEYSQSRELINLSGTTKEVDASQNDQSDGERRASTDVQRSPGVPSPKQRSPAVPQNLGPLRVKLKGAKRAKPDRVNRVEKLSQIFGAENGVVGEGAQNAPRYRLPGYPSFFKDLADIDKFDWKLDYNRNILQRVYSKVDLNRAIEKIKPDTATRYKRTSTQFVSVCDAHQIAADRDAYNKVRPDKQMKRFFQDGVLKYFTLVYLEDEARAREISPAPPVQPAALQDENPAAESYPSPVFSFDPPSGASNPAEPHADQLFDFEESAKYLGFKFT